MKKFQVLLMLTIMLSIGCSNESQNAFPLLKGDYLGQTLASYQPEIFAPGIVSTGMYERDFAISPDGDEIYFSLFQGDWNTIMVTRRIEGVWSEPIVAEFARDTLRFFAEPAFSNDGNKLFYLSTRLGWTEEDIWYVERQPDGTWGKGIRLPDVINAYGEFYPTLTSDGTMYFCRTDQNTGVSQILRSRFTDGAFGEPEVLPYPINGKGTNFNAFIAPDDSYLIGCVGGRDTLNPRMATYMLFFHNADDTWSEGIDLIKEFNLPCRNAISVSLSPDAEFIFFASTNKTIRFKSLEPTWSMSDIQKRRLQSGNGNADIYWMKWNTAIEGLRKKYGV